MAVGIAAAQSDWPKAKPVSILVGFAPGSTTDLVARVIAQKLGETSGASFVVENKPGAGGNIASGLVKRSAPDGYTVVGNQTQMASTSMPPAVPQIRAGKLHAIAVTSAKRSALLPDVPTVGESGYVDFDDYTWIGFFLPVGVPTAIVERFNADINKAMEAPEVRERFGQAGLEIVRYTPVEFGAFLKAEVPKWAAVVKSSGARVE